VIVGVVLAYRKPIFTATLILLFLAQMKKVRIDWRVVGPDARYWSASRWVQWSMVRPWFSSSQVSAKGPRPGASPPTPALRGRAPIFLTQISVYPCSQAQKGHPPKGGQFFPGGFGEFRQDSNVFVSLPKIPKVAFIKSPSYVSSGEDHCCRHLANNGFAGRGVAGTPLLDTAVVRTGTASVLTEKTRCCRYTGRLYRVAAAVALA
jgi:hypothetical protein